MIDLNTALPYGAAIATTLSAIYFSLKNQSKDASEKANLATIESQDRQIAQYTKENTSLRSEVDQLSGKVTALENVVTQAPQIVDLTKVVTELVSEVKAQTHQNVEQNKQVINLLTKMLKQERSK